MLKFIQNFLDIKEKGMIVEIVKFNATDGIHLDGILYKCDSTSKKVLIQIHGMTSNCFKNRDKTIAEKVNEIGIDVLDFNNRGSDIVRYIKNDNIDKRVYSSLYSFKEMLFLPRSTFILLTRLFEYSQLYLSISPFLYLGLIYS